MQHIFRVNAAGTGYTLSAGTLANGFQPQPLDVTSREVPDGYLQAQRRLDAILESRQLVVSLSVQRPKVASPLIAYGIASSAADDQGRPGLVFIHGVVLDQQELLYPCVAALTTLFSVASARQLLQDMRNLAQGKLGQGVDELLHERATTLETTISQLVDQGIRPEARPVVEASAIEHDCAGAQPLAWLTLTARQMHAAPPWEIFEQPGPKGQPETCVQPARGPRWPASRLLLQRIEPAPALAESRPSPKEAIVLEQEPEDIPPVAPAQGAGLAVWLLGGSLVLAFSLLGWLALDRSRLRGEAEHQREEAAAIVDRLSQEKNRGEQLLLAAQVQEKRLRQDQAAERTERSATVAQLQSKLNQTSAQLQREQAQRIHLERDVKDLRTQRERDQGEMNKHRQELDKQLKLAQQKTIQQEQETQRFQYLYQLRLAYDAGRLGAQNRVREILSECKPPGGPQGFEWHLLERLSQTEPAEHQPFVYPSLGKAIYAIAFHPDKQSLVSGDSDGLICWREAWTGQELRLLPIRSGPVWSLALRPDGAILASGHGDAIYLHSQAGQKTEPLADKTGTINGLAFSPDGKLLASVSSRSSEQGGSPTSGEVILWNLADRKPTLYLQHATQGFTSVAFSRDGRLLAAGCRDRIVRVWNVGNLQVARQLGPLAGPVWSVAFSPDQQRLACAVSVAVPKGNSVAGEVNLWEMATGKPAQTLHGHAGTVSSIAFSPDGSRLVSGSADGTVRIWDAASGLELLTVADNLPPVHAIAFHPDGRLLASAGKFADIQLWDATPANPKLAREREAVRALTSLLHEPLTIAEIQEKLMKLDEPIRQEALARLQRAVRDPEVANKK